MLTHSLQHTHYYCYVSARNLMLAHTNTRASTINKTKHTCLHAHMYGPNSPSPLIEHTIHGFGSHKYCILLSNSSFHISFIYLLPSAFTHARTLDKRAHHTALPATGGREHMKSNEKRIIKHPNLEMSSTMHSAQLTPRTRAQLAARCTSGAPVVVSLVFNTHAHTHIS